MEKNLLVMRVSRNEAEPTKTEDEEAETARQSPEMTTHFSLSWLVNSNPLSSSGWNGTGIERTNVLPFFPYSTAKRDHSTLRIFSSQVNLPQNAGNRNHVSYDMLTHSSFVCLSLLRYRRYLKYFNSDRLQAIPLKTEGVRRKKKF